MKNAIQHPETNQINAATFLDNLMPQIKIKQKNFPFKGVDPLIKLTAESINSRTPN